MNAPSPDTSSTWDLDAARRRVRTRSNGYMALVLGPILVIGSLLGLVLRVFGEHDYPAGDIRNEPLFWFVFGGAILAVNVYVAVGNLRARAWRPGPPTAYRDAAPSNPDAPGGVSRSEQ